MTPTDTPRTDAVMASSNWPYHITSEMQKLERELNELWTRFDKQMEAEAEVERLKSDKTHLITQCANLLEALVPSDKSPSTEWHRKQAENNKAYLK